MLQRLEAFLSIKAIPACTCLRLIDTVVPGGMISASSTPSVALLRVASVTQAPGWSRLSSAALAARPAAPW